MKANNERKKKTEKKSGSQKKNPKNEIKATLIKDAFKAPSYPYC